MPPQPNGLPGSEPGPQPPNSVPHNYGAPAGLAAGHHAAGPVLAAARPGSGRPPRRRSSGRATAARRTAEGTANRRPGRLVRGGRRRPELSAGPGTPGQSTSDGDGGRSGELRRRAADGRIVPEFDRPRAEAAVRELLIAVGEDPDREGLRDTPARVARAYAENFAGLYTDPDRCSTRPSTRTTRS